MKPSKYVYTLPEGITEAWAICDAPAGTCAGGKRVRVLVRRMCCRFCGSQMRLAMDQSPPKYKKEKKP